MVAVFFAWLGNKARMHRTEQPIIAQIEGVGGRCNCEYRGPLWQLQRNRRVLPATFLDRVIFVELSDTDVDNAQFERLGLGRLERLEGLSLGATLVSGYTGAPSKVSDKGLAAIRLWRRLRLLGLSKTTVTDAGMAHLPELTNLELLCLADTRITGAGLVHLKGHSNLRTLSLAGTDVTDAGLAHLADLPNLKTLYLGDTQVTDVGVAKLKRALPNVVIVR